MEWAVANDIDVLSMSLGAGGYRSGLIEPAQNAQAAGTTVVAASGNRGTETSDSPANIPGTIAVGASNSNEDIVSFSSGEQVDTDSAWGIDAKAEWPDSYVVPTVAAPGSAIESAAAGGGYDRKSGTSMATPHVAGAVAMLQSATDRRLSPAEIATALETTATKPADAPAPAGQRDTRYGAGIVDVPAALAAVEVPLSASFTVDPGTPAAGESVVLDASTTAGNPDSYEWTFGGDGTVDATGAVVTTEFWTAGEKDVTLTVSRDGVTDTATRTVSVAEPLDAAFTATQSGERTVTFDASATAGAVEYRWDLTGDGAVDATGEQTTFEFWTAGTRTVTLTAVGANGDTATASRSVRVSDLPPVGDAPPRDLDGDGLFEDVRGDGERTILDVQTLFTNLGSNVVQSNPAAFNFDGIGSDEVTILDVQALFDDLPAR